MVGLAAHWMVGSLYSACMGWAIIPTSGWRTFLVVASLPAWLAAAGVLLLMPESPRCGAAWPALLLGNLLSYVPVPALPVCAAHHARCTAGPCTCSCWQS